MSLNLTKGLKAAAAAALLFSASMANAALLQFNLTGDYTASWQLNTAVAPDDYADDVGLLYIDIEGNFPGSLFDYADLYFYNDAVGGGMEIYDYYNDFTLLLTDSQQLYTGPESAPTFLLGSFNMTEYGGTGTYTLTVTDLDAGPGPGPGPDPQPGEVPEPATAAMLLGGLGLMYASRKRRQGK